MRTPLFTALLLLAVSLTAQSVTSLQPEYYSAFKLAERLPGGEVARVFQIGENGFESYSTLTVTAPEGDTLWSYTFTAGNGVEIWNLIPLTDTSFIAHGQVHECDISGGALTVFHTITGERLYDPMARPWSEGSLLGSDTGVRLSSGNLLLMAESWYEILSPTFEVLQSGSFREEMELCRWELNNIVAGPQDNVLVVSKDGWQECPRQLTELRIDSIYSDTTLRVWSGGITNGTPLAIAQKDTFNYIFTDQQLVKTNWSFNQVVSIEFSSAATSATIEFGQEGLFVLYRTAEDYLVTRFSADDLTPIDTFSLGYVPGLIYHDFYVSRDTIYAFGELQGFEGTEYDYLRDAAAVRTITAFGENISLPDTDLELEVLTGGEAEVRQIAPPCGAFNCRPDLYSVSYSGLSVRVANTGTVPITEFYLHTHTASACSCGLCSGTELWRQRFTGLNIAPGEFAELPLEDIFIDERSGDYQLCLWAANVNGGLDKSHENNVACYDFVNHATEPSLLHTYRLFPDRDAGLLNLKTDNLRSFATKVYDVNGRLVGAAAGAGEVGIAMPVSRGLYFVVVTESDGRSQTLKTIW